jgi:UDP-glucose 4-epimerase
LLEQGHDVTIIDDLSTGSRDKLDEAFVGLKARPNLFIDSTENLKLVNELVVDSDAVMHLAALVSVGESIAHPRISFKRNMIGFFNVLDTAAFYGKRLVYASSAAVYGAWQGIHHESRAPQVPLSPYGADKCANDIYGEVFSKQYKFPVIGLRYFNVYGPRQDPKSDYAGVIGKFIDRALTNQPVTIFGDGLQTRNFVHVTDVAKINVAALTRQEGFGDPLVNQHVLVNVGCVSKAPNMRSTTINELADLVVAKTGSQVEIVHAPASPSDIKHSEPALDVLKFLVPEIAENMVQLDDGLEDLIEYLRDRQIPRLIPKPLVQELEVVKWPDAS